MILRMWQQTIALAAASFLFACSQSDDRPPIAGCDASCSPVRGRTDGGSGGTTGSSGTEGVTLVGTVAVSNNGEFGPPSMLERYDEPAAVFAQSPDGDVISTDYDGDRFSLEGILAEDFAKVLTVPEDDQGPLPTLVRVDAVKPPSNLALPVIDRTVLLAIYESLGRSLSTSTGQLVLYIVAGSAGLPNVSVSVAGAQFVAYQRGSSWSETAGATDDTGVVLVGNIGASNFPGSEVQVLATGSGEGEWGAAVVRGAVSYDILIPQ